MGNALSAFTLDAVIDEVVPKPPRVVIYGPHKIGKTTFAMAFPGAIMLQTEDGEGSQRFKRFPKRITEYGQFMTALGALYTGEHDYSACVLDSLDWLEPIIWRETCRRHNKASIEDFDFGKGYVFADEVWAEVFTGFDALRNERNMAIVCTAHAAVTKFISPSAEPYDRYSLKLHKKASAKVQEWADVIGFAHWQASAVSTDLGFKKRATRGISTGQRLLALEERPAWEAGNRFQLPPVMELDGAQFLALLATRYEPVGEYPAEDVTPPPPAPAAPYAAPAFLQPAAHAVSPSATE